MTHRSREAKQPARTLLFSRKESRRRTEFFQQNGHVLFPEGTVLSSMGNASRFVEHIQNDVLTFGIGVEWPITDGRARGTIRIPSRKIPRSSFLFLSLCFSYAYLAKFDQ